MFLILKLSLKTHNIKNFHNFNSIVKKIFKPDVYVGPIVKKKKIKKFCILRSPFKHKDSRDQLEIRFFKEIFFFKLNTKERLITFIVLFLKYLPMNLLQDIYFDIKIEKHF